MLIRCRLISLLVTDGESNSVVELVVIVVVVVVMVVVSSSIRKVLDRSYQSVGWFQLCEA